MATRPLVAPHAQVTPHAPVAAFPHLHAAQDTQKIRQPVHYVLQATTVQGTTQCWPARHKQAIPMQHHHPAATASLTVMFHQVHHGLFRTPPVLALKNSHPVAIIHHKKSPNGGFLI